MNVHYLEVDEKAIRKGHRYVTLVTDLNGRRILEVTPERTTESLATALTALIHRRFPEFRQCLRICRTLLGFTE